MVEKGDTSTTVSHYRTDVDRTDTAIVHDAESRSSTVTYSSTPVTAQVSSVNESLSSMDDTDVKEQEMTTTETAQTEYEQQTSRSDKKYYQEVQIDNQTDAANDSVHENVTFEPATVTAFPQSPGYVLEDDHRNSDVPLNDTASSTVDGGIASTFHSSATTEMKIVPTLLSNRTDAPLVFSTVETQSKPASYSTSSIISSLGSATTALVSMLRSEEVAAEEIIQSLPVHEDEYDSLKTQMDVSGVATMATSTKVSFSQLGSSVNSSTTVPAKHTDQSAKPLAVIDSVSMYGEGQGAQEDRSSEYFNSATIVPATVHMETTPLVSFVPKITTIKVELPKLEVISSFTNLPGDSTSAHVHTEFLPVTLGSAYGVTATKQLIHVSDVRPSASMLNSYSPLVLSSSMIDQRQKISPSRFEETKTVGSDDLSAVFLNHTDSNLTENNLPFYSTQVLESDGFKGQEPELSTGKNGFTSLRQAFSMQSTSNILQVSSMHTMKTSSREGADPNDLPIDISLVITDVSTAKNDEKTLPFMVISTPSFPGVQQFKTHSLLEPKISSNVYKQAMESSALDQHQKKNHSVELVSSAVSHDVSDTNLTDVSYVPSYLTSYYTSSDTTTYYMSDNVTEVNAEHLQSSTVTSDLLPSESMMVEESDKVILQPSFTASTSTQGTVSLGSATSSTPTIPNSMNSYFENLIHSEDTNEEVDSYTSTPTTGIWKIAPTKLVGISDVDMKKVHSSKPRELTPKPKATLQNDGAAPTITSTDSSQNIAVVSQILSTISGTPVSANYPYTVTQKPEGHNITNLMQTIAWESEVMASYSPSEIASVKVFFTEATSARIRSNSVMTRTFQTLLPSTSSIKSERISLLENFTSDTVMFDFYSVPSHAESASLLTATLQADATLASSTFTATVSLDEKLDLLNHTIKMSAFHKPLKQTLETRSEPFIVTEFSSFLNLQTFDESVMTSTILPEKSENNAREQTISAILNKPSITSETMHNPTCLNSGLPISSTESLQSPSEKTQSHVVDLHSSTLPDLSAAQTMVQELSKSLSTERVLLQTSFALLHESTLLSTTAESASPTTELPDVFVKPLMTSASKDHSRSLLSHSIMASSSSGSVTQSQPVTLANISLTVETQIPTSHVIISSVPMDAHTTPLLSASPLSVSTIGTSVSPTTRSIATTSMIPTSVSHDSIAVDTLLYSKAETVASIPLTSLLSTSLSPDSTSVDILLFSKAKEVASMPVMPLLSSSELLDSTSIDTLLYTDADEVVSTSKTPMLSTSVLPSYTATKPPLFFEATLESPSKYMSSQVPVSRSVSLGSGVLVGEAIVSVTDVETSTTVNRLNEYSMTSVTATSLLGKPTSGIENSKEL